MKNLVYSVAVADCYDSAGEARLNIMIQEDHVELNVMIRGDEVAEFCRVRAARWDDRRSVRIGECAGAPVFWCSTDADLSILVGHDDESWDVALTLPLDALAAIQSELAKL